MEEQVIINGKVYTAADQSDLRRAFVVVDRGWLYAGDVEDVVSETRGRFLRIHNALWVFGWDRIGLAEVLRDPKQEGVDIRPLPGSASVVEVPADAEVYRIPVPDGWGK